MRKVETDHSPPANQTQPPSSKEQTRQPASDAPRVPEIGGFKGPEPTRYGDWEHNGRCTDF